MVYFIVLGMIGAAMITSSGEWKKEPIGHKLFCICLGWAMIAFSILSTLEETRDQLKELNSER